MKRTCKLSMQFLTDQKRRKIAALLRRYRGAVNFFIKRLWSNPGGLDKKTLATLSDSLLSERYKSQALKQAVETVSSTRKAAKETGKTASCPHFSGSAVLDAKFVSVNVEPRGQFFDVFIRISTLESGRRITLVTKATAVLRKWLARLDATVVQGCALSEDSLIVWVNVPEPALRTEGDVIAVDLGMCKLVATSEGEFLGTEFRAIRDKINRRVLGSKSRRRAQRERDNFIGYVLNRLPWGRIRVIGREDLRGIKRGKKPGRGKSFRRAIASWTHRQVAVRLDNKAQENGVLPVVYEARGTSRTCPVCQRCDSGNRKGEFFVCVGCGHADDADTVGAHNGLARTLRLLESVESSRPKQSMIETTIH